MKTFHSLSTVNVLLTWKNDCFNFSIDCTAGRNANIAQVTRMDDSAMELGLAVQDSTRLLQKHHDWITGGGGGGMFIENQMKTHNLKLRGFQEIIEVNTELHIFIFYWLATLMQLEDGVAPWIDVAYRLGPLQCTNGTLPQDILVRFAGLRLNKNSSPWPESKVCFYLALTKSMCYKICQLKLYKYVDVWNQLQPCLLRLKFVTIGLHMWSSMYSIREHPS